MPSGQNFILFIFKYLLLYTLKCCIIYFLILNRWQIFGSQINPRPFWFDNNTFIHFRWNIWRSSTRVWVVGNIGHIGFSCIIMFKKHLLGFLTYFRILTFQSIQGLQFIVVFGFTFIWHLPKVLFCIDTRNRLWLNLGCNRSHLDVGCWFIDNPRCRHHCVLIRIILGWSKRMVLWLTIHVSLWFSSHVLDPVKDAELGFLSIVWSFHYIIIN